MGEIAFSIAAAFLTTSLVLHLCFVSGYLGVLASDWMAQKRRPDDSQFAGLCHLLGLAAGTAGIFFRIPDLTLTGILCLALGLVLSPRNLTPLPAPLRAFAYGSAAASTLLVALIRL